MVMALRLYNEEIISPLFQDIAVEPFQAFSWARCILEEILYKGNHEDRYVI